jgi:hypothetical protein
VSSSQSGGGGKQRADATAFFDHVCVAAMARTWLFEVVFIHDAWSRRRTD